MSLKLNLGSGKNNIDTYINIDAVAHTPTTLVGDILNLDYKDSTVTAISSWHVVEHLTVPELDRFFSECNRMLKIGGELEIVAPCMLTAINEYYKGNINIEYLHNFLFALHKHTYDFHKQGIYKEKLEALCDKHNFKIKCLNTRNKVGSNYELVLLAIKEI